MTRHMEAILAAAKRYQEIWGTFPNDHTLLEMSGCYQYWDGAAEQLTYFHRDCLALVDLGHFGMDGFKYTWPEVAKENRRRFLASRENNPTLTRASSSWPEVAKDNRRRTLRQPGRVA